MWQFKRTAPPAGLLLLLALCRPTSSEWGPRDALRAHEEVHAAAHREEAAGADVAALEGRVFAEREMVARIKATKVDMYRDPGAIQAVKVFQEATRAYLAARYGPGPTYSLEMKLRFPEAMGGDAATILLETAPIDMMPHAVHVFLDAAVNRKDASWKCAFHRNAGHVLQALLRAPGARGLAFQEYDARFPHEKFTLGFAGRPGGPEFYVSTVDNTRNHGPGSQGSKTEADSCFAKVVRGQDVVRRMQNQPGAKGMGFISDPKMYIVVEDIALRAA
mmetsp:Transcript_19948/g.59426  ORF Transcript_19948/g.59426 Transcript_19948/m.59426 type:complete len:276 (+) Transcript_19948:128-955(+)